MGAIIKGEGNLERPDSRGLHRRWLPVCNGKRRTCKSAIRKKRQKQ